MKEADLYPPVKAFLESQQYEVKGEVGECDIVALRGTEPPVVVELKRSFNLDVVLQAVDRLAMTDCVYIGVPASCKSLTRRRRRALKLLRMLGLGLLRIDPGRRIGSVEVLLDPKAYTPRISKRRRGRLLGEFLQRVGDPNRGGADRRRGVMTAYRQRAIAVALYLSDHGPTKASEIARAIHEPTTRDILYRNVYGWFDRVSRGVYALSPRGERETPQWRVDH